MADNNLTTDKCCFHLFFPSKCDTIWMAECDMMSQCKIWLSCMQGHTVGFSFRSGGYTMNPKYPKQINKLTKITNYKEIVYNAFHTNGSITTTKI